MANKILIKRTGTQNRVPTTSDLDLAELAINTYDGRLFAKKTVAGNSSIVDLTENDEVTLSGDATGSGRTAITVTLSNTAVTAGSYGGKTGSGANTSITVPIVTVDSKGRVTSVTTTTYSAGADSGVGTIAAQNANNVSISGGTIDGTAIGGTTASSGKFTTLEATGDATVSGSLAVTGNLTVQGTVTTVNSTTVTIVDKNLELASNAANKAAASGGGLTVKLGSDGAATINYISSTDSWDLNQNTNVTGTLGVSGTATAGNLSTAGTLLAGASTLGATTATSLNSTPIGATTASTGAFTSLTTSANLAVTGHASISESLTVKDLFITGTTSLSSVSTNAVAATQVVYGGTGGAFKGESDFTYNETTNTLSAGNLSLVSNATVGGALGVTGTTTLSNTLDVTGAAEFAAAVKLTSTTGITLGTYTTGAFNLAGGASIAGNLQVQGPIYKGGYEVLNNMDTIDGGTF